MKWLALAGLNLNIYDQSTANFPESFERVKIRNLLLDNAEYSHVVGNAPRKKFLISERTVQYEQVIGGF